MIGIGCFAKRIQMATHALGGKTEAIELADGADFVARITIHDGVRTDQRKSILVLVDVVDRDLPAVRVMAEFALCPVFAPMQIRMAVLTFMRHVGEHEIGVTVDALYFCVTAAKRKPGLRVLELQLFAQWFPAARGMAVLARNFELLSVRAAIGRVCIRLLGGKNTRREKHQYNQVPGNWQN
jgi:hypothetical protein